VEYEKTISQGLYPRVIASAPFEEFAIKKLISSDDGKLLYFPYREGRLFHAYRQRLSKYAIYNDK